MTTYYHGTGFPLRVLRQGLLPADEQEGRVAGKKAENSDGGHVYLAPPDDRDLAESCGCVIEVELTEEQEADLTPDPDSAGWMYPGRIPPEQLKLPGDEFVQFCEITGDPLFPQGVQGIARECDDIEEVMDKMDERVGGR